MKLNNNTNKQGKVIIFSAPSGAGKTSIVRALLAKIASLEFSISACSRAPRPNEVQGKDYFFIPTQEFKNKISHGDFLEWEEVYTNHFYGTLNSELSRIWSESKVVIFDVDVKGGINIKEKLGEDALSVFVMPPSIGELENRLRSRKTESEDKIQQRISKANEELQDAKHFDVVLENDNFDRAVEEAESIIQNFIKT
ncbi:MAG: guanylate kinase [Crocinitomicaceae bacterium]|nr:guanylate kinase [Crocinitomicaceae bacterium]